MDGNIHSLPHAPPNNPSDTTKSSPRSTHGDAAFQHSRYAFLNHSAATVNQNLPPSVDDMPLARQRRRRTRCVLNTSDTAFRLPTAISPEDQTVLEAAYARDPKPDKAARLEIVKQVSLGEKEVQIWFQNRRQTSRRKSRPLLPHEIAQYQLARHGVGSHVYSSDLTGLSSPDEDTQPSSDSAGDLEPESQVHEVLAKELVADTDAPSSSNHAASSPDLPEDRQSSEAAATNRATNSKLPPLQQSADSAGQVRHVMYQESIPLLRRSQSLNKPASPPMHVPQSEPTGRLKKSSSLIRISLTGDGNAKVVTKDSFSPSPPHASQAALPIISHSNERRPDQAVKIPPMRPLQRSSSGRSRDSRVWEFWCDKDARSELEEKAEQDASGSAAGAIGLLRSTSGRNILGTIPSKRNASLSRQSISSKRSRVETAVPRLHKSSTTLGRLEWRAKENEALEAKHSMKQKHKLAESSVTIHIPGNESDKENWSPATAISPDGQSEQSSHYDGSYKVNRPPVLPQVWSEQPSVAKLKRQQASFSNAGNKRTDDDPEIAAFMGGARKRNSVSGDEELDCVQGLLSLSQGNWR